MWRNYDVITDEEPLSKQTLGRKVIPVSIGTTSVNIHHETWELWSKIKWHVFMDHGVQYSTIQCYFQSASQWEISWTVGEWTGYVTADGRTTLNAKCLKSKMAHVKWNPTFVATMTYSHTAKPLYTATQVQHIAATQTTVHCNTSATYCRNTMCDKSNWQPAIL